MDILNGSSLVNNSYDLSVLVPENYYYGLKSIVERDTVSIFVTAYVVLVASCIFSQKVSKCPKVVQQVCLVLLLNTTLAVLAPVIVFLYALVCLFRGALTLFFKLYYGGRVRLMESTDVAWAVENPKQCNNFTSLYVLEGKCDLKDIRRRIQTQLIDKEENGVLVYDRLRYRVIQKFGFYCWEKCEDFRIEHNVKLMDEEKEEGFTEEEVFRGLQDIADIPMGSEKPQWEILVVPNFKYSPDNNSGNGKGDSHYAIIFRVHHSIMDGVSAGHALKYAMADKPMKFSVDPLKGPNIHPLILYFAYLKALVLGPLILYRAISITETNCFSHKMITGPKTFGWSKPICMKALKRIKDETKITTTAILMNSIGGAIRSLALKKKLPVPRRILAAPTVAMLPYPDTRPRNRFIVIHFPLEIGLASRRERLEAANDTAKGLGGSVEPLVIFSVVWLGGRLPAAIADVVMGSLSATLIMSNVPGPVEPAYLFGGHELVDSVFWIPLKNWSGIGAGLFSYNGKVRASFVGDSAALPDDTDVSDLIQGFEEELVELGKTLDISSNEIYWKH